MVNIKATFNDAQSQKIKFKPFHAPKSDMEEALAQDIPIEEHFILRLPQKVAERLDSKIKKREVPESLSFVFSDARKGQMKLDNETYATHLVDLPCITESYKTIDNKQFYKIADISQMLIVQDPVNPVRIQKDSSNNE
jgi:transcription initiation factor TFIID subunit 7